MAECPTPKKRRYFTERQAKRGADDIAHYVIRKGEWFRTLYGYICPCGVWHLTSMAEFEGRPNILLKRVPPELQVWARKKETENETPVPPAT